MKKLPPLRGRTVVNLFFEDSTRTRSSFEMAGKWLSADVINVSAKGSSVSKGESLRDTALTVEAMGVDAVVIRHNASGAAHRIAGGCDGSVVNAGDGTHEHPTQALLDAYTMRRCAASGDLADRHVAIVGDMLHRRVARSNVLLLRTLGARVTMVGAADADAGRRRRPGRCERAGTWTRCSPGDVDAVMMLRVQRERMSGVVLPDRREYARATACRRSGWRLLDDDAIVLHPGPMNRGLEISAEAADDAALDVVEQVTTGSRADGRALPAARRRRQRVTSQRAPASA